MACLSSTYWSRKRKSVPHEIGYMQLLRRLKTLLGLRPESPDTTGHDVEVTVEHEPANEAAIKGVASEEPVTVINGIGSARSESLATAGIETVADLAAADPETVAAQTDLSASRVRTWVERARER